MLFRLMKRVSIWAVPSSAALLLLSLAAPSAQGQLFKRGDCNPPCAAPCPAPCPAPAPAPAPKPPDKPEVPPVPRPPDQVEPTIAPEQFAATEGGETSAVSAPNVIGDGGSSGTSAAAIRASALKFAENQNARPQSRIFMSYNYFHDVNGTGANLHREMPGFEQAFADGDASLGMTLPVYQTSQDDILNIRGFGNLNLIGKYALLNDRTTGNVFSSGLAMTLPTGKAIFDGTNSFRDVVFQPFGAFIRSTAGGDLYAQGFSSLAVPTDGRDITIFFNDLAMGYWAYRNNGGGGVEGVVPTLEAHLITPLNHRGLDNTPIGLQDSLVLTEGVHILLPRSIVTLGVVTPITGPKPFDIEALAQFNLRY